MTVETAWSLQCNDPTAPMRGPVGVLHGLPQDTRADLAAVDKRSKQE